MVYCYYWYSFIIIVITIIVTLMKLRNLYTIEEELYLYMVI